MFRRLCYVNFWKQLVVFSRCNSVAVVVDPLHLGSTDIHFAPLMIVFHCFICLLHLSTTASFGYHFVWALILLRVCALFGSLICRCMRVLLHLLCPIVWALTYPYGLSYGNVRISVLVLSIGSMEFIVFVFVFVLGLIYFFFVFFFFSSSWVTPFVGCIFG